MALARSTRETFPYVLEADRRLPKEQQTLFRLRRLSNAQMLAIDNLVTVDAQTGAVAMRAGDQKVAALRAGLAGWENFNDEGGAPVPFRTDTGTRVVHGVTVENPVAMETLDQLRTEDARELAAAILAGNQLTTDDAKN